MTSDFDLEKEVHNELIYDKSVLSYIKKKFPSTTYEDASSFIREDRISVSIPGISYREYFVYAMEEGFSRLSFTFELLLLDRNKDFINLIKESGK